MARADKEFHEYRAAALAQGWEVVEAQTRWKFTPPDKTQSPVFYPSSVGDWRAIRNFISEMRRRGFRAPEKFRRGA